MMRLLPVFLIILLFPALASAQVGNWYLQSVPPFVTTLNDLDMYDLNNGLACGIPDARLDYGGIIITNDGGANWIPISETQFQPALPAWTVWRAIAWLDANTAIVAGDSLLLYKTFNGGIDWYQMRYTHPTYPTTTIRDIYFSDPMNGYMVGGDSPSTTGSRTGNPPLILRTSSGGSMWDDESPNPALPFDPVLYAVRCSQGGGAEWMITGEYSTVLLNDGGGWVQMLTPTASPTDVLTGLTVINNRVFIVSGYNSVTNTPKVYKTTNGGNRYFLINPSTFPSSVSTFAANFFFTEDYGWIAPNAAYLGVTINGGLNWTPFYPPGILLAGNVTGIDFIDPMNGWVSGQGGWIFRYSGLPPKPDISNSDTKAQFPLINCEPFREVTVTIRNRGTGELIINSGDIQFSSSEYQALNLTFPIKIAPGKGRQIVVRWTPSRTTAGSVAGSMIVYSNDKDHLPWTISLEGARNYGVVQMPSQIDMQPGVCLRDSMSWIMTTSIAGNKPPTFIKFEFISGHNEFRIASPPPGTVIKGPQIFQFKFSPKAPGAREAKYRFISGDPACPDTMVIDMKGFGDWTKVTANVLTIDFGKLCVRSFKDSVITLSNVGNTFVFVRNEARSGQDQFPPREPLPIFMKPDTTMKFRVRFAPQRTGNLTAEYRIISEPCPDTLVLRLEGEGISTELDFLPRGGLTLGPTTVLKSVTGTATVFNVGKTPATITSVGLTKTFPNFAIQSLPPIPLVLQPGESFQVGFIYGPLKVETLETMLRVVFSGVCPDTARLPVTAVCVPNPVIDPPDFMDVGLQTCPTPIRKTLYIRNKGNGPLLFFNGIFTGSDKDHFTLIKPAVNDMVPPGDSIRFIVEFNRPTEGTSTSDLFLNHDDFDRMPTKITVTGRRTVVDFKLAGDSATAFFTRLFVPETRTFTIRNTSNQPVTITAIDVTRGSGVFSVQTSASLPEQLQPGGSTTFDVIFLPNGRGPFQGTVRINGQECNLSALLNLAGSGDTDGLSVDRGNIDFDQDPCAYATECDTLRLSNQGNEPVMVEGIAINQTNNYFQLSQVPAIPFTMNPNEERFILVCANPAFLGRNQATVVIRSNDPAYPILQVALRSTRDSSRIIATPGELSLGTLSTCSTLLTRQFSVFNVGTLSENVTVGLVKGSAFTLSGTTDVTLQPGKFFTVTVTFAKPGYGLFEDTIEVRYQRCPDIIRIPVSAVLLEQTYAASPTPLVFPAINIGASSNRQLTISNTGAFDARISRILIQPSGEFGVMPGYNPNIPVGGQTSLQVRFTPVNEALRQATICVIFDWPCPDTICVPVEGVGIRGTLVLTNPMLSFGLLSQCEERILLDTLRNNGTGPTTILGSNIAGPGSAAYSNLTPIVAPEVISPGAIREFRIRYNAALAPADGPVDATLSIATDDARQPVIDLILEGDRHTLRADGAKSIAFGLVELNQSLQQSVTLRNPGSVRLCYTADRVPADVAYTPALPLCLDPGDSATVTVMFNPSTVGVMNAALALLVASPCSDSTVIALSANVQRGTLTQTAAAGLPAEEYCQTRRFDVQITNTFLEDATLDSLRLSGADALRFSIVTPTSFPQTISSGGSLTITVSFTGLNANRTYNAQLASFLTALGMPVSLQTTITAATLTPSLALNDVSFLTTVIGQPPAQNSTTLTNTSGLPVRIDAITNSDPAFSVTGTNPPLPATIQPGQSMTVQLRFTPNDSKTFVDSLRATSTSPCPLSIAAELRGTGIPQPIVLATLSIGTFEGKPDDRIRVPVLADKDLGTAEVRSWSGSLSFNRSMLYPLGIITEGTRSASMNVVMNYDHANGTVQLSASGGQAAGGLAPLVYVEFLVLIGNNVETPFTFSPDFDFTSGYANVIGRTNGVFKLTGYCMVGSRLIRGIGFNKLEQNHPNPVSLSASGTTSITYSVAQDGFVEIALYDALGRVHRRIVNSEKTAGTYTIATNLSALPPGVYYYRMSTGDFAESRRLVIVK